MSLLGAKESKITKLDMHGSVYERMGTNNNQSLMRKEDGRVNEAQT